MVNTYRLVNPHIEGKFNSKIKAKNSQEAANMFYNSLSEHFNNSVPKFYFSIQKGSSGDGKFYHFEVKEQRDEEEVTFKLKPLKIDGEESIMNTFMNKLDNFKAKFNQDGGKKHKKDKKNKHIDDDSDDSIFDSSEEFYRRAKSYVPVTQPIYYWWYDPYIYSINSIYIPTFYSYVTPYIELSLRLN
jgi:hypothetical protein